MESQETIVKRPLKQIKIIYNDDEAVLDFLADLKNRRVLKDIDAFANTVKTNHKKNFMILARSPEDNIVMLILYDAPFGLNDSGNHFMLYVHNTCEDLCVYFQRWYIQMEREGETVRNAIKAIYRLVNAHWIRFEAGPDEEDLNNVQSDFLG